MGDDSMQTPIRQDQSQVRSGSFESVTCEVFVTCFFNVTMDSVRMAHEKGIV